MIHFVITGIDLLGVAQRNDLNKHEPRRTSTVVFLLGIFPRYPFGTHCRIGTRCERRGAVGMRHIRSNISRSWSERISLPHKKKIH